MRSLALAAAVAAASLSACDTPTSKCMEVTCMPCPLVPVVLVTDAATGGAVPAARVAGGGSPWRCEPWNGITRCTLLTGAVVEPVEFDATVTATGYTPATVTFTPRFGPPSDCCATCITFPDAEVALTAAP